MEHKRNVIYFVVLAIFLSGAIAVQGCSKKENKEEDVEPPVVMIITPTNGQIFSAGQSIQISGTITDNEYIAQVHLHIYNNQSGVKLLDEHIYPAAATANFDRSVTAVAGTEYRIEVNAIDKWVNEGRAKLIVVCN